MTFWKCFSSLSPSKDFLDERYHKRVYIYIRKTNEHEKSPNILFNKLYFQVRVNFQRNDKIKLYVKNVYFNNNDGKPAMQRSDNKRDSLEVSTIFSVFLSFSMLKNPGIPDAFDKLSVIIYVFVLTLLGKLKKRE